MRPAVLAIAALPSVAVLAISSPGWGQYQPPDGSIQWMKEDGGSLELLLVREGLCGGVLTLDSVRRLVRWEGAPGDIGCKDGFEAAFDDVKAVRAQSEAGFLIEFKKGTGKRMVLIPLPHAAWLGQQSRFSNPNVKIALESMSSADGDALPNNLPGAPAVKRVEIPKEVVADTQKAVDRVLDFLGRPAPPAVVLREALYGRPADVTVPDLLESPVSHTGKAVRLRGRLEAAPESEAYWLLDGDQSLTVMPEADLATFVRSQLAAWKDKEVELVGLFRRGEEGVTGRSGYLVSFWEAAASEVERAPAAGRPTSLAALFATPAASVGQTVRVVGKFRGRNLYGDLPRESIREGGDWVIKDDRYAIWVIGTPAGAGFKLDPGAPGDMSSWLEIVGDPVVKHGRLFLRAREVALVPPPPGARVVPVRQIVVGRETSPAVVFTLPVEGDAVAPDARFVIQFSKQMDEESFNGRVRLRYAGAEGDGGFRVTARYDEERRSLVVDPGTLLHVGREVELQLLPGIIDVDGMALEPRPGRKAEGAVDVLRYVVGDQG
jgi:hypothetical protein